ncbi:MOSC domain-containing protein [Streptomyces sp. SBT349]|uniref:MOSC domain-containing protein n=1 Tax=Streptomyces sp. SBT349 TaxID=1580539 RepID=UPI00066BD8EA|nr:MOSC N-terminal beta barrel domain-containing protein [Streptomyces sp. SBT349]
MIVVAELHTYPVKGCAGVPLAGGPLTPAGLAHDRAFLVTDPAGVFRTQRRDPALALIHPRVDEGGELLTLAAEGAGEIAIPVRTGGERRAVTLFAAHYRGIDQGEEAAAWLTAVLGVPSRLVRVPPEHHRVTDGETPGTAGWADSGAVHLLGEASLAHLNARIADAGRAPVDMARFRPNIVATGWEPHAEDLARRIAVGSAELAYAKPAKRCAVTVVDQERGTRAGPEPLRTLATYRRHPDGGVTFGVKLSVVRAGKVSVGDQLTVQSPENTA